MSRISLVGILLVASIGCGGPTGPIAQVVGSPGDLSGTWVAQPNIESRTTLELHQFEGTVTGNGTWWGFINPPTGTLTVSGVYDSPHVALTITYDKGWVLQFTGTLIDGQRLVGSFPGDDGVDSLTFTRQ